MRECGEDEIACPSCEQEQRASTGPNLPGALMAAGRPVRTSSKPGAGGYSMEAIAIRLEAIAFTASMSQAHRLRRQACTGAVNSRPL